MPNTEPEIQVACALIWRDGQILLSKRHQSAHQGGLWEFPGGKFETGEDPKACLNRELEEELGIRMQDAEFMFQIPWDYGDKTNHSGCGKLFVFDLNAIQVLRVKRCNGFLQTLSRHFNFQKRMMRSFVRSVCQGLRIYDPSLMVEPVIWGTQTEIGVSCISWIAAGVELQAAIDAALGADHQVILTWISFLFRFGCGVHCSSRVSDARGQLEQLVNLANPVGIRHEKDIERQRMWPSDALLISPVRETPSHDHMQPLEVERFSELARKVGVPAYALGVMFE